MFLNLLKQTHFNIWLHSNLWNIYCSWRNMLIIMMNPSDNKSYFKLTLLDAAISLWFGNSIGYIAVGLAISLLVPGLQLETPTVRGTPDRWILFLFNYKILFLTLFTYILIYYQYITFLFSFSLIRAWEKNIYYIFNHR